MGSSVYRTAIIANRLLFPGDAAFSIIYFQFSLSILNFHFQFPIYDVPPQLVCFPLAFPNLLPSFSLLKVARRQKVHEKVGEGKWQLRDVVGGTFGT